mmetsp:Transcript_24583/g.36624  ORF Transcript_24583/g.36624 Transcript_24583/m.36624 type:complete len:103 (+) Transcript_24583:171-479(+)
MRRERLLMHSGSRHHNDYNVRGRFSALSFISFLSGSSEDRFWLLLPSREFSLPFFFVIGEGSLLSSETCAAGTLASISSTSDLREEVEGETMLSGPGEDFDF